MSASEITYVKIETLQEELAEALAGVYNPKDGKYR
jgi:hypothetical protein